MRRDGRITSRRVRRDPLSHTHIYYKVLQCVAVCCSVLQCVAVCCSVLQCVAVTSSRRVRRDALSHTHHSHTHTYMRRMIHPLSHTHMSLICAHIAYGVALICRLLKIICLFAKETYKRDNTLQKRLIILRSLLIVGTP